MLGDLILLGISVVLAKCLYRKQPKDLEESTEENYYKKAGRLTYEFFYRWGTNDEEMKRLLLANDQDLREFAGYSRWRICEIMKRKAELTGKAYTRKPF